MKPLVVLLHGALRTRFSLLLMQKALERAGFDVLNRSYPWRSRSLSELARSLHERLVPFDEREIHFVTHSFGSFVVREYLHRYRPKNVGRIVFLAPPSRGALLAQIGRGHPALKKIFLSVFGKACRYLDPKAAARLAEPDGEFAVIAGGRGLRRGFSPWLPGDNDGVVRVEETKLPRMKAFALLPHTHTFIMNGRDTIRLTVRFLKQGSFRDRGHNT